MSQALDELIIAGVATNQAFHRRLMADTEFQKGEIDIQFLERRPDLLEPSKAPGRTLDLAVAAALAEEDARHARRPAAGTGAEPSSEWARQARREGIRAELPRLAPEGACPEQREGLR
jgi:3-methylcrotonyl-CoA carboxylase alpha subunit